MVRACRGVCRLCLLIGLLWSALATGQESSTRGVPASPGVGHGASQRGEQTRPSPAARGAAGSRPRQPHQPRDPGTPSGVGAPLAGLAPAELERFRLGRKQFVAVETVEEGIGPVFNATSCVECHGGPAVGGGSQVLATRIGTRTAGQFDPLIRLGGPVLQRNGIEGLQGFEFSGEIVPPEATVVARRRSTPTFGFGLVDATPDTVFHALATRQALLTPATAGRVNKVADLRTGRSVVGKFGWKAAVPNLLNFAGDAYKEELGVTTPGWRRDADGRSISEENPPQGNVAILRYNPVGDPNDDDLGDVQALADFMTFLAPPPRGTITADVTAGEAVFVQIGCADCHTPQLLTGVHAVAALNVQSYAPYSDFLLHDMGSLGDGIEQGQARGSEMRTAPLWGLRFQKRLLHDGRARTVTEAISQHAGQGSGAARRFEALNETDRASLLAFLNSL